LMCLENVQHFRAEAVKLFHKFLKAGFPNPVNLSGDKVLMK
jgi:hypothetical protein